MARKEFLPFSLPLIGDEEKREVLEALDSGWITTGPRTQKLEEQFSAYIGCKHAIAVNSCTAGLHLSLAAVGVGAGNEVVTSPFTFCATANVIVHLGATPVFADIDPATRNIDPLEIAKKITLRTKAILPVHYGGHPCAMDEIMQIAEAHRLSVVEDAAHAVAAEYKGRKVGSIGDLTSFSFYATKNLTTGEGGMITTNNSELEEKIRPLTLHGINHNAWKRYEKGGSWYYEVLAAGYKYNLSDILAAIGIHQLEKLSQLQQIRMNYVKRYNAAFAELPEIEAPYEASEVKHAWHLYTILIKPEKLSIGRAQFIAELQKENIGTSVHFIPLHLQPYYRNKFGFKPGDFPQAEYMYERIISLPLYPRMSQQDVEDVITAVTRITEKYATE